VVPIGELARSAGVKIPTIRYYEQIGLLGPPRRTGGRQRRYGQGAVRRLHFIRHARDLGFSVEDIRELLALSTRSEQPCENIDKIAVRHLASIDQRIAQLTALRAELTRMLDQRAGSSVAGCYVIESLAH
jgi:DNA-binding transcriptional MerR regulator